MFRAFLFDLDGVLVDTAKYHYAAWKKLADSLCIPFDEYKNEAFKGVSRIRCMELLSQYGNLSLSREEIEKYASIKNDWYVESLNNLQPDVLLPGTVSFLQAAKKAGIACAVCSASKNARAILNALNLTDFFDVIVDGTLVTKAKPDPEVFLLAARQLGAENHECVIFEDSLAGVQAGHTSGIYVVGIGKPENLPGAQVYAPDLAHVDLNQLLAARNNNSIMDSHKNQNPGSFPIGEPLPAHFSKYFIGKAYLHPLTTPPVVVDNVTFEPAARNNWHIHRKTGQILIVVGGTGWYQEWGKEPQCIKTGDVVNIPPDVKHWHGADQNSWFAHLSVTTPVEGSSCEWLEPVTDDLYTTL